jgi:hypothetical protein
MSKLQLLRDRLIELSRRRWRLRAGAAAAGLLLALFWTLAAMFLLDWQFEFDKPQRVVLFAMGVAAWWWAWQRYSRPLLGRSEDELEMALLVERQQRIDSDLVAALQFERPIAASWGSPQLATAVVDYVAEFGRELNVLQGLPTGAFRRRAALLAVTSILLGIACWAAPGHWSAFFNRLLLGSRHYPTRTVIQRVVVNGRPLDLEAAPAESLRSPYWEPLRFEVHGSGVLPRQGAVRIKTVSRGDETELPLAPEANRSGLFVGRLDRLVDSVDFQVYLGDAWTDAARVTVIPPPVVELLLNVTPPSYAAGAESADDAPVGSRQIAVIEGSSVELQLASDKPLKSAELQVAGARHALVREAASSAGDGDSLHERWRLLPRATPLKHITEPLKYEIQVIDRDGLSLKEPIEGFIRIKADRPPRVTAAVVTEHVLPSARPSVSYGASDDYGLARLRLHRQIVRQSGETSEDRIDVPLAPPGQKTARGRLPLDLAPLGLAKGDQLKVTFEALDFRGDSTGKAALSEPLVLHVTDERGVLAAMVEADERSARQLDAIIQRQLGIGDSP